MAAIKFIAQTAEVSLTAATTLTVLNVVAPTNQRVKVLGWGVSFDGINTTILETPVDTYTKPSIEVELITGTSAGTYSHTLGALDLNGSLTQIDGGSGTIQSAANSVASSEPTATGVVDSVEVNPVAYFEKSFPKGNEPVINGGSFVAIRCTAPDAVNCRVKLICEE